MRKYFFEGFFFEREGLVRFVLEWGEIFEVN